jgi:hypothetical protein
LAKYPTPATMVVEKEESSHSHFLMLMEYLDWRDQELSSDREDEYEIRKPFGFNLIEIWLTTHLFVCFCSLCLFLLLMLMILQCCLSIKMNRNTQPQLIISQCCHQ